MNSWSPYRLATLFVAVVTLVVGLAIMPAQAHHCKGGHASLPGCGPGGGGGGGGGDPTPQECALEFQGTFDDRMMMDGVGSEKLYDSELREDFSYSDGEEKVQFTSGTLQTQGMLRFDTNASAKVEKPHDIRWATLDFRGASSNMVVLQNAIAEAGFDFALKGIDLRFDFTDGVGLNVCSLIPAGEPGHVPGYVVIDIVFLTGDGEDYSLSYGCRENPGDEPNEVDVNASKAVVRRTGASTWTIEGVSACLRDGPGAYYPRIDLNGGGFDPAEDQIQMPFKIFLEALP